MRSLTSERVLEEALKSWTNDACVEEVLLIGGAVPRPLGPFTCSMDVLRLGKLERFGIGVVGFAGHPEGSPDIPPDACAQALLEKERYIRYGNISAKELQARELLDNELSDKERRANDLQVNELHARELLDNELSDKERRVNELQVNELHARGLLDNELSDKERRVNEHQALLTPLRGYIITQFCFDPVPIFKYLRTSPPLPFPTHIGLPGLATLKTLIMHAQQCGIGNSIRLLLKRAKDVTQLVATRAPDNTLRKIAQEMSKDQVLAKKLGGIHLYPLGGIRKTAQWRKNVAEGKFQLQEEGFLTEG